MSRPMLAVARFTVCTTNWQFANSAVEGWGILTFFGSCVDYAILPSEPGEAFEYGKWGDRPRPRS